MSLLWLVLPSLLSLVLLVVLLLVLTMFVVVVASGGDIVGAGVLDVVFGVVE